jgi:hypothetical protein
MRLSLCMCLALCIYLASCAGGSCEGIYGVAYRMAKIECSLIGLMIRQSDWRQARFYCMIRIAYNHPYFSVQHWAAGCRSIATIVSHSPDPNIPFASPPIADIALFTSEPICNSPPRVLLDGAQLRPPSATTRPYEVIVNNVSSLVSS